MDKDHIRGMLIGVAIGDALGAAYEFNQAGLRNFNGVIDTELLTKSMFQGTRLGSIGQVTDDTEMTMMICHYIAERKMYDKDIVLDYMEWANGCSFLGKNTRALLHGVKTRDGYRRRMDAMKDPEEVQGNGCLMRCSPLSCLPDDVYLDAVETDCKITNPSSVCIDACKLYTSTIRGSKYIPETKVVQDVVVDAKDGVKRDVIGKTKGWVINSLYCALYENAHAESFREGIERTIRRGGDTDTNGAIVGGLLGAKFGWKKMREDEKTLDNWRIVESCDTSLGQFERPLRYHPKYIPIWVPHLERCHRSY